MVPERSMIHSRQQTPAGVWGELRHVQIDRRVERLKASSPSGPRQRSCRGDMNSVSPAARRELHGR